MSNIKEIKNRISSIKDTQKITNAMYMIASNKLMKAKRELDQTRPYFNALKGEIKRIFRTVENIDSKYFYPIKAFDKISSRNAVLVITADKGLAGSYNQNVIKEAMDMLEREPETKLFVVGEYGRQYFLRRGIVIKHSFLYTAQNPSLERAREISSCMLDLFLHDRFAKIFVIYTDHKSALSAQVVSTRLLPFHKADFVSTAKERAVKTPFDFYPSIGEILDSIMESYITGFIYSALVDSFCSEQNARMNAMRGANENAEKLLSELSLEYNRVRQSSITQEITELSAGSRGKV